MHSGLFSSKNPHRSQSQTMIHRAEYEHFNTKNCPAMKKRISSAVGFFLLAILQVKPSTAFIHPEPRGRHRSLLCPSQRQRPQLLSDKNTNKNRTNAATRKRIRRIPSLSAATSSSSTQLFSFFGGMPFDGSSFLSIWYLGLLALQFGCQPLLTKAFTPSTIIRSTVVLAQDVVRLSLSLMLLVIGGNWRATTQQWTMTSAIVAAGVPSILYLFQNYFTIMAYQNLPPITFNVLNQTKTLSAALCCFLIMGKSQSRIQIFSLFLLLTSALVIEKVIPLMKLPSISWFWQRRRDTVNVPSDNNTKDDDTNNGLTLTTSNEPKQHKQQRRDSISLGVIPVLLASFISGLAGALSQKHLQHNDRNSYLFSMEISMFSMFFLICSLVLGSPDGKRLLRKSGAPSTTTARTLLEGWTWKTWIPIITNASGGIVVGLVTKKEGAVRKGFALIFGLLLSGILQNWFWSSEDDGKVTSEQMVGGILAGLSLWLHSSFPPILRK